MGQRRGRNAGSWALWAHSEDVSVKEGSAYGEEQDQEDTLDQELGDEDEDVLLHVKAVGPAAAKGRILIALKVDNIPLTMELDTGASVSVITLETWKFPGSSVGGPEAGVKAVWVAFKKVQVWADARKSVW